MVWVCVDGLVLPNYWRGVEGLAKNASKYLKWDWWQKSLDIYPYKWFYWLEKNKVDENLSWRIFNWEWEVDEMNKAVRCWHFVQGCRKIETFLLNSLVKNICLPKIRIKWYHNVLITAKICEYGSLLPTYSFTKKIQSWF